MGNLGTVCIGAIVVIGVLIALALLSKLLGKKDPPAGTYDKKDIDSGGSIGGMNGGRAYDRPDINSGGSIGGDREHRAHDHPDVDSGGSIGGGPSVGKRPGSSPSTSDSGGRVDSPDIKSGGSFGG